MEQFYTGDPQPQQPVEDLARPAEPHTETKIVTVEDVMARGYKLTSEEAKRINMLRHPRLYMAHLATFGLGSGGFPFPLPGELQRSARSLEWAREQLAISEECRVRGEARG